MWGLKLSQLTRGFGMGPLGLRLTRLRQEPSVSFSPCLGILALVALVDAAGALVVCSTISNIYQHFTQGPSLNKPSIKLYLDAISYDKESSFGNTFDSRPTARQQRPSLHRRCFPCAVLSSHSVKI